MKLIHTGLVAALVLSCCSLTFAAAKKTTAHETAAEKAKEHTTSSTKAKTKAAKHETAATKAKEHEAAVKKTNDHVDAAEKAKEKAKTHKTAATKAREEEKTHEAAAKTAASSSVKAHETAAAKAKKEAEEHEAEVAIAEAEAAEHEKEAEKAHEAAAAKAKEYEAAAKEADEAESDYSHTTATHKATKTTPAPTVRRATFRPGERLALESGEANTTVARGLEIAKKFAKRLPNGYAAVIDESQRDEIYQIQEEYYNSIEMLKLRLQVLESERDHKIDALLGTEQKAKLKADIGKLISEVDDAEKSL